MVVDGSDELMMTMVAGRDMEEGGRNVDWW